jgi:hypothetical protein
MGNTNSSPRYRSRSPDPSSLDQTWNNSYPKVERERSNRSQWQQQSHQQQQIQPKQKHLAGGYPAATSTSGSGVMVNGHLNSAHYDQFEQECIQHHQQQQQQQSKLSDQQPLRFARCVKNGKLFFRFYLKYFVDLLTLEIFRAPPFQCCGSLAESLFLF